MAPRICRTCKQPLVGPTSTTRVHPDGYILCDPKEVKRATQTR